MTNQNVTLAARKTGEVWEAALVVDGKFMKAFTGTPSQSLSVLVGATLAAWLGTSRNDGTEIGLNINISEPDAK